MKKCLNDHSLSDPGIFNDSYLLPHADVIKKRRAAQLRIENKIISEYGSLDKFADYHDRFGLHFADDRWIFTEWAPNAEKMYIVCEKTGWQIDPAWEIPKKDDQVFQRVFEKEWFSHQQLYRLHLQWPQGEGARIPSAARRVVQDPATLIFNAQVWQPSTPYQWRFSDIGAPASPLLIYEAHVGMALEEGRIGTYGEFEHHILPKIVDAGYTAILLMAVLEHPYYGSFGYHVSSFFAPSSRFGTPEELRSLIDAAHSKGIVVLMDMIHSHAVNNEVEGLSRFDGTLYQFFHGGTRGRHHLWDSRCFDYNKQMVLRFLLSNLKYWIEKFNIDGFRFDGITSMLFEDHGLGRAFTSYNDYYGPDVDESALSYLYLANRLIHRLKPHCITIAEDVSGYPGLAAPQDKGGVGFDFRYAMGIADYWIKLLKDTPDENWHMGALWYELTAKRSEEKTISYAESHDQALVGDKTIMMHLMGRRIYDGMHKDHESIETFRAVALHKMIRLITLTTAGSGYLNFMGNEFGHPEWVDFPGEHNNFSFHYARRQWSLKYDPHLYYSRLHAFDKEMIRFARTNKILFDTHARLMFIHESDKIIAYERAGLVFVFNFNPTDSFTDYLLDAPPGKYRMVLDTDADGFGGKNRLAPDIEHFTRPVPKKSGPVEPLSLYLPSRAGFILKKFG